ncbi:hypothetical protein F2Q68_00011002 [Brassica cretica]|uniref:Uncharacterized protein n=1 Tax=Brassica cretica TaxID=69181 RepID=A0A8S9KQ59_BRACR|nr:hypothetical protein F2Q68_00011002 [Brassica cretica]
MSSSTSAGLGWTLLTSPQNRSFQKRLDFVGSPLMAEGLALREAALTCRSLGMRFVTTTLEGVLEFIAVDNLVFLLGNRICLDQAR